MLRYLSLSSPKAIRFLCKGKEHFSNTSVTLTHSNLPTFVFFFFQWFVFVPTLCFSDGKWCSTGGYTIFKVKKKKKRKALLTLLKGFCTSPVSTWQCPLGKMSSSERRACAESWPLLPPRPFKWPGVMSVCRANTMMLTSHTKCLNQWNVLSMLKEYSRTGWTLVY